MQQKEDSLNQIFNLSLLHTLAIDDWWTLKNKSFVYNVQFGFISSNVV